jgi:hypothetical protein
LVPDSSGTPVAVELGFRLTGGSLINIANVNPTPPPAFDTSNPGAKIFGWEVTYPDANNRPEGIEANCTGCTITNPTGGGNAATIVAGSLNEMFVALGSGNFTAPGPKPFLKITATGPSGGSQSSTLQWLGVYGIGGNKGRITQITGMSGSTYTTGNFDTFAGSASQFVPEPTSAALIAIGAIALPLRRRRKV